MFNSWNSNNHIYIPVNKFCYILTKDDFFYTNIANKGFSETKINEIDIISPNKNSIHFGNETLQKFFGENAVTFYCIYDKVNGVIKYIFDSEEMNDFKNGHKIICVDTNVFNHHLEIFSVVNFFDFIHVEKQIGRFTYLGCEPYILRHHITKNYNVAIDLKWLYFMNIRENNSEQSIIDLQEIFGKYYSFFFEKCGEPDLSHNVSIHEINKDLLLVVVPFCGCIFMVDIHKNKLKFFEIFKLMPMYAYPLNKHQCIVLLNQDWSTERLYMICSETMKIDGFEDMAFNYL